MAQHVLVQRRPASLLATKGLRRPGTGRIWRLLYRIVYLLAPPFAVLIPQEGGNRSGGFPILVSARRGGVILIDHHRGEVRRFLATRRTSPEQIDVRRRLARYLDVPELSIGTDGLDEREPYVGGRPFVTSPRRVRIRAASVLLRQYRELTAMEARPAPPMFWENVLRTAGSLPLPASARRWLQDETARSRWLVPFTPAHGDLSGFNILLNDTAPKLIDLEECGWLPAYFDFFFLNHQEWLAGRSDLWEHFIIGDGWDDLAAALRRAGENAISRIEWLAGAFLVACGLWETRGGPQELNEQTLVVWWAPVLRAGESAHA